MASVAYRFEDERRGGMCEVTSPQLSPRKRKQLEEEQPQEEGESLLQLLEGCRMIFANGVNVAIPSASPTASPSSSPSSSRRTSQAYESPLKFPTGWEGDTTRRSVCNLNSPFWEEARLAYEQSEQDTLGLLHNFLATQQGGEEAEEQIQYDGMSGDFLPMAPDYVPVDNQMKDEHEDGLLRGNLSAFQGLEVLFSQEALHLFEETVDGKDASSPLKKRKCGADEQKGDDAIFVESAGYSVYDDAGDLLYDEEFILEFLPAEDDFQLEVL